MWWFWFVYASVYIYAGDSVWCIKRWSTNSHVCWIEVLDRYTSNESSQMIYKRIGMFNQQHSPLIVVTCLWPGFTLCGYFLNETVLESISFMFDMAPWTYNDTNITIVYVLSSLYSKIALIAKPKICMFAHTDWNWFPTNFVVLSLHSRICQYGQIGLKCTHCIFTHTRTHI